MMTTVRPLVPLTSSRPCCLGPALSAEECTLRIAAGRADPTDSMEVSAQRTEMQSAVPCVDSRSGYTMSRMGEGPLCVLCRTRPQDPRWRPFCSERCRTEDLARWAEGSYR